MKKIYFLATLLCFSSLLVAQEKNVFELEDQSMLMTGKGPGQDGAINPYAGEDSIAIVENLGTNSFSIRLQRKGEIIKEIPIKAKEIKKVPLPKGTELYFDTELKTKIKLDFKRMAY